MLVPLALAAHWLVPLIFGAAYLGAVPLLWILTPGAVFLACGQVVGDLLRGRSQPGAVAWAQGLAAVFTVVLLFDTAANRGSLWCRDRFNDLLWRSAHCDAPSLAAEATACSRQRHEDSRLTTQSCC